MTIRTVNCFEDDDPRGATNAEIDFTGQSNLQKVLELTTRKASCR
jgi:hypothetical protein